MQARERFLTTINGGTPDRPPVFATFTPQVALKMSKYLDMSCEEPIDSMLSTRISHMDLLTTLGNDAVGIAANAPDGGETVERNGLLVNEWGMVFKDVGLYNEFVDYPLAEAASRQDIENYPFPDPFAPGRFSSARNTFSKYNKSFGVIADLETSFFETAWYLTGLEKLLMDLMKQPEYVNPLLDKILVINTEMGKQLISMGADLIWAGDDFGTQSGMILHPDLWRDIFKPRIKWMFEQFRQVNPIIKIAWHSCGSIIPIIKDFIEIGLDVLNPIQPLAEGNDPVFLKKEFGKDLVFFGGIDVQHLLPFETPGRIKDEVKKRMEILGKDGGYIVAPAHNIQDDTPEENILAFFEAVKNA